MSRLLLLKKKILLLEQEQMHAKQEVKMELQYLSEQFSPIQLIGSALHEILPQTDKKPSSFLRTIIGATAGFVTKRLFMGKSHHPIKEILGTLLEVKLAQFLAGGKTKTG